MLKILHLEDCKDDAFFIRKALEKGGIAARISVVRNREEFLSGLTRGPYDLILLDNGVPAFDSLAAIELARSNAPGVPIICVSGAVTEERARQVLAAGAVNYILKDQLGQLVAAVRVQQEKGSR